jgi:hypothetical protein
MSTQKLTWYFWGQNRFGNLLPFLTRPILDIDLNFRAQVFLRALCAALGPMFFVLVAKPRSPRLVVYVGLLIALLLVYRADFLFSYFDDSQPYGTSLAVLALAVIIADRVVWRLGFESLVAGAAVFVILCVGLWVNLSAVILIAPWFAGLSLVRRSRTDLALLLLTLAACALISWHGASVEVAYGRQYAVFVPAFFENVGRAATSLSFDVSTMGVSLLGLAATLAAIDLVRRSQAISAAATLLVAAFLAFVVTANIEWVVLNNSFPRYFIFPVTGAIAAFAVLITDATWQRAPALRLMLEPRVPAMLLVSILVASWITFPLAPRCRFDNVSASSDEISKLAMRLHAIAIEGDYWTTWPAVIRTISRSRREVYGLAIRAEATRMLMRKALVQSPDAVILCIGDALPQCLDRLATVLREPSRRTATIIESGRVETLNKPWLAVRIDHLGG